MKNVRPPTATIAPMRGSSRICPTGPAAAASSTESAIPEASEPQKTVDRTSCGASFVCTSAEPRPMSPTVGANIASATAIAASP